MRALQFETARETAHLNYNSLQSAYFSFDYALLEDGVEVQARYVHGIFPTGTYVSHTYVPRNLGSTLGRYLLGRGTFARHIVPPHQLEIEWFQSCD